MINIEYGFVFYPELECQWDLYWTGRPVTLAGYEVCTSIPEYVMEAFNKLEVSKFKGNK